MLLSFLNSLRTFLRVLQFVGSARVFRLKVQRLLKSRYCFGILSKFGFSHTQSIPGLFIVGPQLRSLSIIASGFFIEIQKTVCFTQVKERVLIVRVGLNSFLIKLDGLLVRFVRVNFLFERTIRSTKPQMRFSVIRIKRHSLFEILERFFVFVVLVEFLSLVHKRLRLLLRFCRSSRR